MDVIASSQDHGALIATTGGGGSIPSGPGIAGRRRWVTTGGKTKKRHERFYASDTGKVIDEDYLDYVRSKPCVGCGKRPVDADHLVAKGFGSGKRNDHLSVPACRECHVKRHAKGNRWFEETFRVNLWRQCAGLLAGYLVELKKKGGQNVNDDDNGRAG